MIPEQAQAEIARRLARAEAEHGVRILFASESGSRAWGFPSPDSDFDARFVYVHPRDWYLSIHERRDVIEQPIEGLYDVNGWDLRKALRLLVKPNPTLLEWLKSPHFYHRDEAAIAAFEEIARDTAFLRPCRHHYAGLARGQWRRHFADAAGEVPLKKYFYALRPALALRWLRLRPREQPPMTLQALMAGVDLPLEQTRVVEELVALKAETREMGAGPRIATLDALILSELDATQSDAHEADAQEADAEGAQGARPPPPRRGLVEKADALFRRLIGA